MPARDSRVQLPNWPSTSQVEAALLSTEPLLSMLEGIRPNEGDARGYVAGEDNSFEFEIVDSFLNASYQF